MKRVVTFAAFALVACGPAEVAPPPVYVAPAAEVPPAVEPPPAPAPALLRVDRRVSGDPSWLVVLLHGYASSPADFEPLARALAVPADTRVIVPEAPLPGPGFGRAWWALDPNRIVERTRDPRVLEREDPMGLELASALVRETIARERGDARVVLAGFSQGAMLAVAVALELEPPPAALIVASGAFLARPRLEPRVASVPDLRVMVAHGRQDPVVPFAAGDVVREVFDASGHDVRMTAFGGGHSIGPDVVEDIERFLYEVAGEASASDGPQAAAE